MRLKEDHDSWKASGVIKRDFRHTHNGPDVDRHAGAKKRKPGKKRSDHKHEYDVISEYYWTPWYSMKPVTWQTLECYGCDKQKTQRLVVK